MSLNPYAQSPSSNLKRRGFVIFSLLYWSLFFLFAETTVVGDGVHYFTFFPALLSDGNLNLADEFVAYPQGSPFALGFELLPSGYAANPYPFGSSLLQLPFLLGAWLYDRTVGLFSEVGVYDFLSAPYLVAQILSTWFYGWIGCFCLWRILDRVFKIDDCLLIVLAMVTATPLLNYLIHDPAYSHAYSFFAVSLFYFLWFCVSRKDSFGSGILIGAAGGLVFLVRWQDVLFLFPAAVYSVGMCLRGVQTLGEKKRLMCRLAFISGGLLGFFIWISPQLIYWKILYGTPVLVPLGEKIYSEGRSYFEESLFSKKNGLFKWHPITLLATIGLLWMAYRKRWLWWILPAMVLQFLFIGSLADWTGSYAFGQRRWVSGLPFWAMGLAALFSIRWKPWRWVLRAGIIYLILWNILVYLVWHNGYFEGGRHSTSKVFWMIQNTPELLFGNLFDLAFFNHLVSDFSVRRVSLFLLAFLAMVLTAVPVFWMMTPPIGRRTLMWTGFFSLTIPLVLGMSFIAADKASVETLQARLSVNAIYPNHPVPLLSVQKGKDEVFSGEIESLLLEADRKSRVRFQNPQLASQINLIAYLSSAAPEIRLGQECLSLSISGSDGEESKTLHVGEELDFPNPEFGSSQKEGGILNPQTVELGQDGTIYFSYGVEFPFSPMVVKEMVIENLLPMGEIGIEVVSLDPFEVNKVARPDTSQPDPILSPTPMRIDQIFNGSILNASPASGLIPGGTLEWRGVPFQISDSTEETCLSTGLTPQPVRFSTPVEPSLYRAVHFLLGTLEDKGGRADGSLAALRLHFEGGLSIEETVVLGRDVSMGKPLYSDVSKEDYWAVEGEDGGKTGLSVKTVLVPQDSGPLLGIEIIRDPKTDVALVVYAASAVP